MSRPPAVRLALVLVLVACGGDAPQEDAVPAESAEAPMAMIDVDTLAMPEIPEPRRGHLVGRSVGMHQIAGAWPARAAACDDPAMVQVLAEEPGAVGTLVLLQLPSTERVTSYPVAIVDSGAPAPPASQVGVQLFGAGSYAFQALDGAVEVYGYGRQRISGRFAVTLREIATEDRVKYAGIFDGVPVEQLPEEQCAAAKRALAGADTAASDSR